MNDTSLYGKKNFIRDLPQTLKSHIDCECVYTRVTVENNVSLAERAPKGPAMAKHHYLRVNECVPTHS